eukprot:15471606-Alexandrium_andersonii.AAC.1
MRWACERAGGAARVRRVGAPSRMPVRTFAWTETQLRPLRLLTTHESCRPGPQWPRRLGAHQ